MKATVKTTDTSRLPRWAWRLVSVIAMGLTCLFAWLGPGWAEIGDDEDWPVPYPKPAFAQGFPTQEQVSDWLGATSAPIQASIPDKPLFRGMTAGQRELRNFNLDSGWMEKWSTAQGSLLVVEGLEYREMRLLPKPVYNAEDDWSIPGSEGATVQYEDPYVARVEMGLVRGRVGITVTLTLAGENPVERSKEVLASVAQHLASNVPETADKPLPGGTPRPTDRQAMRLTWVFMFLCAIILSVNTSWRQGREKGRLLAKFSAARRNSSFADITKSAALLRSRSRAIALLRMSLVSFVILLAQVSGVSFEVVNILALATLVVSVVLERYAKRQSVSLAKRQRIHALPLAYLLVGWGIAGWMAWVIGGTIYSALINLAVGDPESPQPYWMIIQTDLTVIAVMLVVWPVVFLPIWVPVSLQEKR